VLIIDLALQLVNRLFSRRRFGAQRAFHPIAVPALVPEPLPLGSSNAPWIAKRQG
jgi:hypothetical protein